MLIPDLGVIDPDKMQKAAVQSSELLKALSNQHRLLILCNLLHQEMCVSQLAECLNLRSSNVSQHLSILRRDKIIISRRDGQTIWYTIDKDIVKDIIHVLYDHLCS